MICGVAARYRPEVSEALPQEIFVDRETTLSTSECYLAHISAAIDLINQAKSIGLSHSDQSLLVAPTR